MAHKRGRLSKEEKAFITANATKMAVPTIAMSLGRPIPQVSEFISENVKSENAPNGDIAAPPETPPELVKTVEQNTIREELRGTERWKRLRKELTEEELRGFEEEYVTLYGQFGGDVLASEKNQIVDAIKLELLKSRNMVARRKACEEIAEFERRMKQFYQKKGNDATLWTEDDRKYVAEAETILNQARGVEQNKTNEYVKLQAEYNKLMGDLKATRQQRVKDKIEGNTNWLSFVKQLQNAEIAEYEGKGASRLKAALDKEQLRLGRVHKFEDGSMDRALLTPETVSLDDDESEISDEA